MSGVYEYKQEILSDMLAVEKNGDCSEDQIHYFRQSLI